MKKLVLLITLFGIVACDSVRREYGEGGVNACRYAKEQLGVSSEDIESVEIVGVDTLLSDFGLGFGVLHMLKSATAFLNDEITKAEFKNKLDSMAKEIENVSDSWEYVWLNDSMKKLDKLVGQFRKVYTVKFNMKSGDEKKCRVMMDHNGIKPSKTEYEMGERLMEINREWQRCHRHLYE